MASSEAQRRLPDSKGHKKLLQLLTSPTEELGIGGSGASGPPVPPPNSSRSDAGLDCKDASGGMTSPSSTGVSSSSAASGQAAGQAAALSLSSAHYTGSLQEKHKILHKLLQNGNTPDEVAKITAEATGKVSLGGQEASEAAAGVSGPGLGSGFPADSKQEQHSPKKEKTHALLHYLLNKDDSKEPVDVKPKLEELEGKGPPGTTGGPLPEHPESKIKSEPSDDVRCVFKFPIFALADSFLTYFSQMTHFLCFFPIQLHNLESILGDLRGSSSDFYPDLTGGGAANRTGNKPQGCLDDGLQGECFKS